MVVWHVCTAKKLAKYLAAGEIHAPVRAWENVQQAERMSKSTGRKVILRLRFPDNSEKLPGHFGQARVMNTNLKLDSM